MNLTIHHLRFTLRATTLIHLGPQAGAQIRGALWAALQQFACTTPTIRRDPDHAAHCPMCRLMALENQQSARGANPPRPFVVRPPFDARVEDRVFYPDDTFTIGVNLFGDVVDLFPYVCQAFYRMGEIGMGYGRGQFSLERVEASDPFTSRTVDLFLDRRLIASPGFPIRYERIQRVAALLPTDRITLHFYTPVHIKHNKQRLTRPTFEAIIARLLERCQAIELHYTNEPTAQGIWRDRYLLLTEQARAVQLTDNQTRWLTMKSSSRRTNSRNSISGFVGTATFTGDLAPFREWLLWGQSLHIGKNAVKGNGWYEIVIE